ncbi:MAG: hypothetical protein PHV82_17800, partial [Victivallaceae bacterium]|nr:hypothetical protein [Victivallaceae bacterium]
MWLLLVFALWVPENLLAAEKPSLKITPQSSVLVILGKSPAASAAIAADDLVRCLKNSVNCRVKIAGASDKPTAEDILIYVGESEATAGLSTASLKPEQFIIKVVPGKIFLLGRDEPGDPYAKCFVTKTPTMYAVYNFLRRFSGVRWLWPGKSGEIIPRRESVSVPYMDKIEGPALPLRYSYYNRGGLYGKKSIDKMVLWGRRNGLGAGIKGQGGHSSTMVVGNKYYDKHPEYYALINGSRRRLEKYSKLCHSNP